MTKPRRPLLCAVDGCIRPRSGEYCLTHYRLWHKNGFAKRVFKFGGEWADAAEVRAAFERGAKRPPRRKLHIVKGP